MVHFNAIQFVHTNSVVCSDQNFGFVAFNDGTEQAFHDCEDEAMPTDNSEFLAKVCEVCRDGENVALSILIGEALDDGAFVNDVFFSEEEISDCYHA